MEENAQFKQPAILNTTLQTTTTGPSTIVQTAFILPFPSKIKFQCYVASIYAGLPSYANIIVADFATLAQLASHEFELQPSGIFTIQNTAEFILPANQKFILRLLKTGAAGGSARIDYIQLIQV